MNFFYRRYGKRVLDLGITILLSPIALPLSLLTALVVRLALGSPILFTQQRIGLDSRPFLMRKFRTMRNAAAESAAEAPDADRLSKTGTLLRRLSLDELPELVHVVKGEMSLVGPRPLLPRYLPLYSAEQARRHEVRPGLTGLAQVRGRNALSWDDKLAYDVRYVDTLSLRNDLTILAMTCWTLLRGQGVSAPGHTTMPEFRGRSDPGQET